MHLLIQWLIRYIPRKHLQLITPRIIRFVGKLLYAGKRVQCPICGCRFRSFMPYGRIVSRKNALCPGCLSLERHRLLWIFLKQETNFFSKPLSVLHIAPEHCFMEAFEKQHADGYISADLESPLSKIKMDIHDMPLADKQFDVVLCNHVLEHVNNDLKALSEIKRVLKPGGWGILQVPIDYTFDTTFEDPSIVDPKAREKAYGQSDHVRQYGKDYRNRLGQQGFDVEVTQPALHMSDDEAYAMGLVKNEEVYLVRLTNP